MSAHPDLDPDCDDRPSSTAIELIVEARSRSVGTLTVARVLPSPKRRLVGPFCFIDRGGPVTIEPGAESGIGPHPHIGLSTLTYVFEGESVHRDSTGAVQLIRPGDVNLMTAGRGVVHSERPDPTWRAHGGVFDAVQIWLALPAANEDDEPSFEHVPRAELPEIAPAPGVRGRLVAGAAFGARSPLRHPGEPLLVDLELDAGAAVEVEPDQAERGVLVISGDISIDRAALTGNMLAILRDGATVTVRATTASRVLLVGGPHLGDRVMDWNFVASTRERLERARDAWIAGTFPLIPGNQEPLIPYPDHRR